MRACRSYVELPTSRPSIGIITSLSFLIMGPLNFWYHRFILIVNTSGSLTNSLVMVPPNFVHREHFQSSVSARKKLVWIASSRVQLDFSGSWSTTSLTTWNVMVDAGQWLHAVTDLHCPTKLLNINGWFSATIWSQLLYSVEFPSKLVDLPPGCTLISLEISFILRHTNEINSCMSCCSFTLV